MLRYRDIMAEYAKARGPILERTGSGWEVAQFEHLEPSGCRAYRVSEEYSAADIQATMAQFSSLAADDARELVGHSDGPTKSAQANFTMLTRAASSL